VDDRTNVVLLNVETFAERRRFPHTNYIMGVGFSPNGQILATGSDQLRLWDASTGRLACAQPPGGSMAFSHNGDTVATSGVRIHLRDAATGELRRSLIGHSDKVFSMAFTPDDRMLATGSKDGHVKFWDMRTFQELATFSIGDYEVSGLSFSGDGKTLVAACGSDNGGRLVDWSIDEHAQAEARHTSRTAEEQKEAANNRPVTGR
jgi:WD40 repeat protein